MSSYPQPTMLVICSTQQQYHIALTRDGLLTPAKKDDPDTCTVCPNSVGHSTVRCRRENIPCDVDEPLALVSCCSITTSTMLLLRLCRLQTQLGAVSPFPSCSLPPLYPLLLEDAGAITMRPHAWSLECGGRGAAASSCVRNGRWLYLQQEVNGGR